MFASLVLGPSPPSSRSLNLTFLSLAPSLPLCSSKQLHSFAACLPSVLCPAVQPRSFQGVRVDKPKVRKFSSFRTQTNSSLRNAATIFDANASTRLDRAGQPSHHRILSSRILSFTNHPLSFERHPNLGRAAHYIDHTDSYHDFLSRPCRP